MLEINDSNFKQEVEDYSGLVMVDFWAPWCGACQASAPAVESISEEYKDRVKVAKLNVDDNHELASRFGVMSIPTFIFFRGGKEVERKVGMQSQDSMKEILDRLLKG